MKRTLWLLLVIMAWFIPTTYILGQDGDTCSTETIMSRVAEVYTTFSEAGGAADLESALNGMNTLNSAITAIYAECDEVRYQEYVEEGTALLEDLQAGGYVLYVRHAKTDSSQTDTDLASCETQRNLSEQGRLEAANIGAAWSTLNIPVGMIVSTEYCRTRDTAQLAFGEPNIIPRTELEETLDDWLAQTPAEGMNMVIVGHVDLLEEVTGIQIPEEIRFDEGDALVYRPLGGPMGSNGYELVTRISLRNWFDLSRIATEASQ